VKAFRLRSVALVAFASGCLGESPGVSRDASEAWHCDEGNVSVTEADVMTNCPTMASDSDHKCWKVEGCGKTAFVRCSLSPGGGRRSRRQWSCGSVSPEAKGTDGRSYIKWSEALLESAKKDIPCADVSPINFQEGHVVDEAWIVEGCGVQVTYVAGQTASDYTTPLVLSSRRPIP
jgi:hypothetical protein